MHDKPIKGEAAAKEAKEAESLTHRAKTQHLGGATGGTEWEVPRILTWGTEPTRPPQLAV